ncbi:MAG TPA: hypothetical protein VGL98_09695, partial [Gammaproteobacteria bacterium]
VHRHVIAGRLDPVDLARIEHMHAPVRPNEDALASIRELVAKDSGDHDVVLHDGTVLRLSRSYKDALYEALNARE